MRLQWPAAWLGCGVLFAAGAVAPIVGAAASAPSGAPTRATPVASPRPGSDAHALWRWVRAVQDARGAPFAIIDKRAARLWLFDAAGAPVGDAPVLLGRARGDASVPGIGERAMVDIRPHERTTPAGRFVAEPGRNKAGEDIFWIDYEAAVSMHRLRRVHASERRDQRLASATASDNRITYGCINVPPDFYDQRLRALFVRGAVVYILPDTLPVRAVFSALR
jgi:hypothetical protein